MKISTRRLLVVTALAAATLCASPTDARRGQSTTRNVRIPMAAPASVDVETRDGKIVSMTAVMKDGKRLVLGTETKPTCDSGCPAGQTLSCFTDHENQMSVCECVGGGGGGHKGWIELPSHGW